MNVEDTGLATPTNTGPRYELAGVWFNASEIYALLTIEHLLENIEPGVLQPLFGAIRERLATVSILPVHAGPPAKPGTAINARTLMQMAVTSSKFLMRRMTN